MHTGGSEEQLAGEIPVRGKMKDCCCGSQKKVYLKREVVSFSQGCKFTENSNG